MPRRNSMRENVRRSNPHCQTHSPRFLWREPHSVLLNRADRTPGFSRQARSRGEQSSGSRTSSTATSEGECSLWWPNERRSPGPLGPRGRGGPGSWRRHPGARSSPGRERVFEGLMSHCSCICFPWGHGGHRPSKSCSLPLPPAPQPCPREPHAACGEPRTPAGVWTDAPGRPRGRWQGKGWGGIEVLPGGPSHPRSVHSLGDPDQPVLPAPVPEPPGACLPLGQGRGFRWLP